MIRIFAIALAAAAVPAPAAVIGHIVPAESLTPARIARSGVPNRAAWLAYLDRSARAMRRDKAVLAAERRTVSRMPPPPRETVKHDNGWAKNHADTWYASAEARAIADTIVSYQTPAGGWGKNLDRTAPPRVRGQHWIGADSFSGPFQAQDGASGWAFVGTLDNEATTTEMRFLARVQAHLPGRRGDTYRAAFLKGVAYLLAAQFPNGGWPQVYPLQGGYHDALTLNDDAVTRALDLLRDAGEGNGDYAFVPAATRDAARAAAARALDVLLALQVAVDGRPTIWAQQYDALLLRPVAARNYEPAALATAESAGVLTFLMSEPATPRIRAAVEAGVAWFRAHPVRDRMWVSASPAEGPRLVRAPGAPLLWARFYDPASGHPVFADRNRTILDDPDAISLERRVGYGWFNTSGTDLDAAYRAWRSRL